MCFYPVVEITPAKSGIAAEIQAACGQAKRMAEGVTVNIDPDNPQRGQLLFPGEPWEHPYRTSFSGVIPDGSRIAKVLGCVAYRDEFKDWHHTHFCFEAPLQNATASKDISVCNGYNDAE
jgi:hypothetical protein